MTDKDFVQRAKEQMQFIETATKDIKDPVARMRAENTAMRAKILELYAQLENIERLNERLRGELSSSVKGDVTRVVNPNAPKREPNDVITLVAAYRDGSKIERRLRGAVCNWWFSTPSSYIRVRSVGDDPFGIYVPESRRGQWEAQLVDLSKKLDRDATPLCVIAYNQTTGKKLF
jgi:hypothetical protein